jgi:O-antigen/teichoic acid export membrane protein
MSTARTVIKNTGFLYAKMGITMFISLYTTRLILNALGVSDFGIFNIVGGAIAMLGFLNASMAPATQRFMSYAAGEGNVEKQKMIFNISVVLHFFIAVILGVALIVAGFVFFNGLLNIDQDRVYAAKFIYGSLIISTMFSVMTVPYDAVLNAHENMLYYAIVGVVESLLKLAVALLVVIYGGDKLILYGILMACIPLIIMAVMRFYCHKTYNECIISPRKYWDKTLLKEMGSFAGWNFLAALGSIIGQYGQGIVLNMFFGTIINAAQGIANQLNGQVSVFVTNMQKALNPIIVKNEGKGNRQYMLDISLIGTRFSFFISLFFVIPFITHMELLLKWWLGNVVTREMILFSQLTLVRSLVEQFSITLSTSISATGKIKRIKIIAGLSSILSLVLSFFLFKYGFDSHVLYYVFISNTLLIAILVIVDAKSKCGLSLRDFVLSVLVPCLIVTFILLSYSVVFKNIMHEGVSSFIIYCAFYLVLFISLLCFIGLNSKERKTVSFAFKKYILRSKFSDDK